MIKFRPSVVQEITVKPMVGVSIDPGTRNLGWAIILYEAPMDFVNLCLDTNYQIVNTGHIDLMKDENGNEGDNTKAHFSKMLEHYFAAGSTSEVNQNLLTLKRNDPTNKRQYGFYSENQEGIGPTDRELNKYLADQLMPMCHINGALGAIISLSHNIKNVNYPNKTAKWGNSSCPTLVIENSMLRTEKQRVHTQNKVIRKRFFTYFVLDLLERQRNGAVLKKISALNMDDKAHLCDSITQGMRAMMVDLWGQLETQMNKGFVPINTKLPLNTLTEDIKLKLYGKLGSLNVGVATKVRTAAGPKNNSKSKKTFKTMTRRKDNKGNPITTPKKTMLKGIEKKRKKKETKDDD